MAVNTTVISDIVQISGGQCFNLGSKDAAELVLFTIWRWQFAAVPKSICITTALIELLKRISLPPGATTMGAVGSLPPCAVIVPRQRPDLKRIAKLLLNTPGEWTPARASRSVFVVFHYGPKERCEIFGGKRREVVRFQACRSLEEGSTKLAQTPGSGCRALDAILSKTATNGR